MNHLRFYCIQPIRTDNFTLTSHRLDTALFTDTYPTWIAKFISLNNGLYDTLNVIKTPSVNEEMLESFRKELCERFLPEERELFKESIEEIEYYCLFESNVRLFFLVHEVSFAFSQTQMHDYFNKISCDCGLYMTLRSMFVIEDDDSALSSFTMQTREFILSKVITPLYDAYTIAPDFQIEHNTGNITNIALLKESDQEIISALLDSNNRAERLYDKTPPIVLNDGEIIYNFKGRFHTIILFEERHRFRFLPIQFQMQLAWYEFIVLFKKIKETVAHIKNDTFVIDRDERIKLIEMLLHRVNEIVLYDENFKSAIEIDHEQVYKKIEHKWNADSNIRCLQGSYSTLKNYLKNIQADKTESLLQKIELLENEQRLLEEKNAKDHLTRAYTRAVFESDINATFDTKKAPFLTVAFVDGDRFKRINDTYGHQAGDEVLKMFVNKMHDIIRKTGIETKAYRYGGEEFVMLIHGLTKQESLSVLELIRRSIQNHEIIHEENLITATVSIGVAFYEENDTPESIVKRADDHVYKAKEEGRNRVIS